MLILLYQMDVDSFGPRTLAVRLNVLDRVQHRVSEITTKYHSWLLGAERVQEVTAVPGQPGFCDYRIYMTAQGVGAYYILLTAMEDLVEGHREYAESLRTYFLPQDLKDRLISST